MLYMIVNIFGVEKNAMEKVSLLARALVGQGGDDGSSKIDYVFGSLCLFPNPSKPRRS